MVLDKKSNTFVIYIVVSSFGSSAIKNNNSLFAKTLDCYFKIKWSSYQDFKQILRFFDVFSKKKALLAAGADQSQ